MTIHNVNDYYAAMAYDYANGYSKYYNKKSNKVSILTKSPGGNIHPGYGKNYASTEIKLRSGNPKIIISDLAFDKIRMYVNNCNLEIGWLGDCYREGSTFYIKDVYLFEQEVTGASTDLSAKSQVEVANELISKGEVEAVSNLRFWGHSHVNMDVSPSHQDDVTMEEFAENFDLNDENSFFIRGIFNKHGDVKFTIYLYKEGLEIDNVIWYNERENHAELEAQVRNEIEEKVKHQPVAYKKGKSGGRIHSFQQPDTYAATNPGDLWGDIDDWESEYPQSLTNT